MHIFAVSTFWLYLVLVFFAIVCRKYFNKSKLSVSWPKCIQVLASNRKSEQYFILMVREVSITFKRGHKKADILAQNGLRIQKFPLQWFYRTSDSIKILILPQYLAIKACTAWVWCSYSVSKKTVRCLKIIRWGDCLQLRGIPIVLSPLHGFLWIRAWAI